MLMRSPFRSCGRVDHFSMTSPYVRNISAFYAFRDMQSEGAYQPPDFTIEQASSFEEFRAAMPLLRASARKSNSVNIRPGVGVVANRLRHEGSGPSTGCILLARTRAKIVGCLVLWVPGVGEVELKWLYVQPPYRCRGIEERLVYRAEEISWRWRLNIVEA